MTSRQYKHAAKMRARRGKRPYDEVHEDNARRHILRMRKLFQMGMSDEFIANALDENVYLISILRTAQRRSH
jgi:hypothetical protein